MSETVMAVLPEVSTRAAVATSNGELCESPIFVVGSPRSGCEALQWALREHPLLWGSAESSYLASLLRSSHTAFVHGTQVSDGQLLPARRVTWPTFAAAIGTGINLLYSNRADGLRWVDQTEGNIYHLDDLAAMFPGSVFLLMQRDGRAVVDALRRYVEPRQHEAACREWQTSIEAGLAWSETAGERSHVVGFERLVTAPEPTLDEVFRFLGLEPAKESVRHIEQRSPAMPEARPTWSRWSAAERRQFHDVAGDTLIALGYEDDDAWSKEPVAG